MDKTKLIKQLVLLCIDKGLEFEYKANWRMLFINMKENPCYSHEIILNDEHTIASLIAAIRKVGAYEDKRR